MGRVAALCVVAAVCVPTPTPSRAAAAHVPYSFIGMDADSTTVDQFRIGSQSDSMVKQGVGVVRFEVNWAHMQPYKKWSQVPNDSNKSKWRDENGTPTYYVNTDRIIGALAERHLLALPMVEAAPKWAARKVKGPSYADPPKKNGTYARFMAAMVRRYGPGGSFWDEHPELEPRPVEQWQLWNEPNIRHFWNVKPWDKRYVSLLRAGRKAIKGEDPAAKIVFAGLARDSWNALSELYAAGAGGAFDIMAVHPFTKKPSGVVTILKKVRAVMKQHGDGGKQLYPTEVSWPSAKGKTNIGQDISVTPKQQAKNLTAIYKLLAKKRKQLRIPTVFWYAWLGRDRSRDNHFDYAGVVHLKKNGEIKPKPAYDALGKVALGLEGCTAKADVADACTP